VRNLRRERDLLGRAWCQGDVVQRARARSCQAAVRRYRKHRNTAISSAPAKVTRTPSAYRVSLGVPAVAVPNRKTSPLNRLTTTHQSEENEGPHKSWSRPTVRHWYRRLTICANKRTPFSMLTAGPNRSQALVPWLEMTVFAALMLPVVISLGFWQLDRAA